MVDIQEIWLMLALVFVGFWKPMGWVMVICGIGIISMAIDIMAQDEVYAMPFLFLGLGQFLVGVFRARVTGR